jgi:uncharacterized membrane protein
VETRRVESFSDGVFAVAITILVFNLLPIADQTASNLHVRVLAGHWPAYFAYVVSFLTIGIMWLNHHTMLAQVTRVNRPTLVLNLLLLMGIVALPFPTALVADHLVGSAALGGQGKVATVTYGLLMIAISVAFGSMWLYMAGHARELGARRPGGAPRISTIRFIAGNAGYVAATLIALVSPVTALIIYGLLAVYYMFEHLPVPGDDGGNGAARSTD